MILFSTQKLIHLGQVPGILLLRQMKGSTINREIMEHLFPYSYIKVSKEIMVKYSIMCPMERLGFEPVHNPSPISNRVITMPFMKDLVC